MYAMASETSSSSSEADARSMRGRLKRMNWKSNLFHFKKFTGSVPPTEEQEQLLRSTPFAWVLDIPANANLRCLVQNMFDNWDPESKCFIFHGKHLNFTRTDIALILGLQDSGVDVILEGDYAASPLYLEYFKDIDITSKYLENLIRASRSYDSEGANKLYCQLYILYFFSCCFFSTTSSVPKLPSRSLIDCVDDFENLDRYNWCDALYRYMAPQMESIGLALTLRAQPEGPSARSTKPMLKGFPTILAVWMCEHIPIIKTEQPHRIPRLMRWTWNVTQVKIVKKMINQLSPAQIIVDLVPTAEEIYLLPNLPAASHDPALSNELKDQIITDKEKEVQHLVQQVEHLKSSLVMAKTELEEARENFYISLLESRNSSELKDHILRDMDGAIKQRDETIVRLNEKLEESLLDLHASSSRQDEIMTQKNKDRHDLLQKMEVMEKNLKSAVAERDKRLIDQDLVVAEKDSLLAQKEALLSQRDALISEHEVRNAEQAAMIGELRRKIWDQGKFDPSGSQQWGKKCVTYRRTPLKRKHYDVVVPSKATEEIAKPVEGKMAAIESGHNEGEKNPPHILTSPDVTPQSMEASSSSQGFSEINRIVQQARDGFGKRMPQWIQRILEKLETMK